MIEYGSRYENPDVFYQARYLRDLLIYATQFLSWKTQLILIKYVIYWTVKRWGNMHADIWREEITDGENWTYKGYEVEIATGGSS